MRKYKRYIKKYLVYFILGPLLVILESCGEFILPYINANIIDIGAANKDVGYILKNGAIMVIISIFMLVFGVIGAKFAVKGASYLARDLRQELFLKIQRFSFSDIDKFSTGSLITRLTNDINQIQGFVQTLLRAAFRSPVMLCGALFMSFVLNPKLALIVFLAVPFLGISVFLIIKTASSRYVAMQKQLDRLNSGVEESVTSQRVIKSFVSEDYEIKKFNVLSDSLMEKSISALKTMMLLQPISAVAINGTTLLVVWFAGNHIVAGDMELGTLAAFITYLTQILNGLNMLANIILQGSRASASSKRVFEVLESSVSLTDEDAQQKSRLVKSGSIEFKNVYFKYFEKNKEYVLKNINLYIKGGSTVGIIGPTGSGKSTLVSLIPRLYDVSKGKVMVDGICVQDMSLYNLREGVAAVLQKNVLFSGTVRENLLWGSEEASDKELWDALKTASIDEYIRSLPNGLDTDLGQGGAALSGGQRQRLCIARALLKKPKIIIFDDSTSAVDTATEANIRQALENGLKNVTKIIIAQRITSVINADMIVVMDSGRIIDCGTHTKLMESCPEYQMIYYSQKDKEGGGMDEKSSKQPRKIIR